MHYKPCVSLVRILEGFYLFQRFIAILGVLQITIGSIPPSIHASQIVPEVNLSRIYSERPRNSVVFQRQPRGQGLRTLPTQSVHGVVISVDTRDEKACEQVRRQLLSQRKDQSNDEVSALRDLLSRFFVNRTFDADI